MRLPAVAVFTKTPVLGQVKTRLSTLLSADERLALHVACIEDLAEKLEPLRDSFEIHIFQTEPGELPEMCSHFKASLQSTGDLGKRLETAARSLLESAHESVIFLGSDCPHLDPALLLQSAEQLRHCQVVIGPSADGGYYLLGLRRLHPALFHNIEWGTETVLGETIKRLQEQGIDFRLLAESFDLDRPEDLKRLLRSPAQTFAPRTANLLRKLNIR
jgi:hypothetical protein